jgi:hypothetical protein
VGIVEHGMWGAYTALRVMLRHLPSESQMKKDRKDNGSSEPLGIIISRGDKTEPTPVFSAYIWGPVPDAVVETETRAA